MSDMRFCLDFWSAIRAYAEAVGGDPNMPLIKNDPRTKSMAFINEVMELCEMSIAEERDDLKEQLVEAEKVVKQEHCHCGPQSGFESPLCFRCRVLAKLSKKGDGK